MKLIIRFVPFALLAAAQAADFKLPPEVSWVAMGQVGIVQGAAIGAALHEAAGVNLRIVTADSDLHRNDLLRQGKVDFEATAAAGSLGAQEGVFEFAHADWGPQKVRLILTDHEEDIDFALAVVADSGIRSYADLKGRRVAWYLDTPINNINTAAYLAYGGLTWEDVKKVPIKGSFKEAIDAMEGGQVDAAWSFSTFEGAFAAVKGPRGLFWPPLDPKNAEGLARMKAVAPYFLFHKVLDGANVDHTKGLFGAYYPYPILIARADSSADLAFNMAAALLEIFPRYKGKAPGINGWRLDQQDREWLIPYHDGVIAYFKKRGLWTAADQTHNDRLIARQDALAAAWKGLQAEKPADWERAWDLRRRDALKKGGFPQMF